MVDAAPRFVINVRASEKIRHDALTDILELLNARYKLAETVLFHRTKSAPHWIAGSLFAGNRRSL